MSDRDLLRWWDCSARVAMSRGTPLEQAKPFMRRMVGIELELNRRYDYRRENNLDVLSHNHH